MIIRPLAVVILFLISFVYADVYFIYSKKIKSSYKLEIIFEFYNFYYWVAVPVAVPVAVAVPKPRPTPLSSSSYTSIIFTFMVLYAVEVL